jgi:hypothetical protein
LRAALRAAHTPLSLVAYGRMERHVATAKQHVRAPRAAANVCSPWKRTSDCEESAWVEFPQCSTVS